MFSPPRGGTDSTYRFPYFKAEFSVFRPGPPWLVEGIVMTVPPSLARLPPPRGRYDGLKGSQPVDKTEAIDVSRGRRHLSPPRYPARRDDLCRESDGSACRSRAATPAASGQAMEVPRITAYCDVSFNSSFVTSLSSFGAAYDECKLQV